MKKIEKKKGSYFNFYMTQQEVADVLGVSRETVAAIEKVALSKVHAILLKKGYQKRDFV